MLHRGTVLKVVKVALVIFIGISISGCYNLKTIPSNRITQLPPDRKILLVHANDSIWAVNNYYLSGDIFTGKIFQASSRYQKLQVTHIYVAPPSAVKIEEGNLIVPIKNIGKTDYYALNWWEIVGVLTVAFYIALIF